MDVADAVGWAFREMMIEGEIGAARSPDRGGVGPRAYGETSIAKMVRLGTIVDNSGFRREPDPADAQGRVRDALHIASAVHGMDATLGLGERVGGQWVDRHLDWDGWLPELIGPVRLTGRQRASLPVTLSASAALREAAYAGGVPGWRPEGPGCAPSGGSKDDPLVLSEREWLDLPGGRRIRFDRTWCPVHVRDAREIALARMGYALWHLGLEQVAAELKGRLETVDLTGPAARARPWAAGAPVLEGPLPAAPEPAPAVRKRAKRSPKRTGPLDTGRLTGP